MLYVQSSNLLSLFNYQYFAMEVKVGHFEIKEFHFHIYWLQNNGQAEKRALAFKEELIEQVKQNRFIVVCDGIDGKILPALKSPVPKVNRGPIGPHPCGSYEVGWLENNLNFLKIEFLFLVYCRFGAPASPLRQCYRSPCFIEAQ